MIIKLSSSLNDSVIVGLVGKANLVNVRFVTWFVEAEKHEGREALVEAVPGAGLGRRAVPVLCCTESCCAWSCLVLV